MKDFIDAPVKTYSSGMYMRLGFAVAIHVDPDVLLVDEVLAVGDEGFTHKCLDKFAEFKRRGKTILLVTHSLGLVERFCDEALWLDGGAHEGPRRSQARRRRLHHRRRAQRGSAAGRRRREGAGVDGRRSRPTSRRRAVLPDHPVESGGGAGRHVPRDGRPLGIARGRDHRRAARRRATASAAHVFHTGERLDVRIRLRAPLPIDDFVVGIGIFNAEGVCCYGTNTSIEELTARAARTATPKSSFTIDSLDLVEGTYKLDVAVHKLDGYPYDYHRLLYTFRVKSRTKDVGIYRPRHAWRFSEGIKLSRQPGQQP